MTGPSSKPFRSCLLVAPRAAETLPLVGALHGGDFAVLARPPEVATARLALSGEFDVVLVWCDRSTALLAECGAAHVPVIAVLAEISPALAAECLGAGADACIQSNADALLVVAQVNAVLRRYPGAEVGEEPIGGLLQVGDLTVDIYRCEVERDGEFIALTASEYRIVEYMARNAGHVLRPHEILNATSEGYEYLPREAQEVFKVYARRIRRKLEVDEEEPRYLVNVRGFGYRLDGGVTRAAPAARGEHRSA